MLTKITLPFLLTFLRFAFVIIFAFSFTSKMRQRVMFEYTITQFKLIPPIFVRPVAKLFLVMECIISILLLFNYVYAGFVLVFMLLTLFSIAVMIVLTKGTVTACNCFGADGPPVSTWTLGRNGGLMLAAIAGIGLTNVPEAITYPLSLMEVGLVIPISFLFSLFVINMQTIKQILNSQ